MRVKITRLNNLQDIKKCFAMIKKFYTHSKTFSSRENCYLKEIYDHLIEGVAEESRFLLVAKMQGEIVGNIIATDQGEYDASLIIKSIMVEKNLRKKGLARKLLNRIIKEAKKRKFKAVKIEERERANGFFVRAGFIPYLYVKIGNGVDIEKVKKGNINNFKILIEGRQKNCYFIKYDVEEEAVEEDRQVFKRISDDVDAVFVYEKVIASKRMLKKPIKKLRNAKNCVNI